ncbi:acetylxylan esterase [Streptomyces sp. NBC_01235]|uniref:acetylxylan esterase n=1 Tax=Streptomyces sp. NBC_01235 TaxID=2903788 RepID=UPI002E14D925|nr:acetylxylan esterase [Streptomyces sp. NBC_01235]
MCPPSTVYAAFSHYTGTDRTMTVWPLADHGGGFSCNTAVQLKWLHQHGLAPPQQRRGADRRGRTSSQRAAASFLCHVCETRQPSARRRPLESDTGSIFQNG